MLCGAVALLVAAFFRADMQFTVVLLLDFPEGERSAVRQYGGQVLNVCHIFLSFCPA
jgi:hypothetical protein